jgi:hypothetical protein
MAVINDVDFGEVIKQALAAAKVALNDKNTWSSLKDIVQNISDGFVADIKFIAKKKLSGEFNENDAKIYFEDQKIIARVRIRSLAIITLQIAERILNAVADIFRAAINTALGGWILI